VTTEADRTVVYGGRWPVELPAEHGVALLDDWQVLPGDLERALDAAAQLIVLDPLSFPFESLTPRLWDIPMAIALPTDLDGRELQALLGAPVLSRLGVHDVLIGAGDRFDELARCYHLPQANRLDGDGTEPATAVLQLVDQAALHREVRAQLQARSVRRRDAWALRTRADKSAFNVEAGAVAGELARIASTLPWGTSGRAVVLGCGSGEWLMVGQRAGFKVTGFDLSHAAVQRSRFNYPRVPVRHPGLQPTAQDLAETADAALIAGTLGSLNQEARLRMLAWMWSTLRPGGSLLVLDDCVGDRGGDWLPVTDLTAAVLEATANHAVLEDARALRLEGETFHRVGLITYAKLGGAERL
jgi:SAM-dependent methyltransferase